MGTALRRVRNYMPRALDMISHPMSDMQLELNDPAMLRVLLDTATMQRWEILRRAQRSFSAAELAEVSKSTIVETQKSLDWLAEARLVLVKPASTRHRHITYRAAMERLFLRWDRNNPADIAAWRAVEEFMRAHSRQVVDDAARRPGAEMFAPKNYGGSISVMLTEEDAAKVREAFRAAYAVLAEADQRARGRASFSTAHPYHVAFDLKRLWEPQPPMAEFFVIEATILETDRKVLLASARRLLSPREFQIAKLLEAGRSRPEIAAELGLTPNTVASLGKVIYRKLGVSSRAELAARMRLG